MEYSDTDYIGVLNQESVHLITHAVAQMSLRSDSQQPTFLKQRMDYINEHFPDRHQKTHIFPKIFKGHGTPEAKAAERKVYDMLTRISDEPMFAMHSKHFSLDGLIGECDFIILHKDLGIIILEVKSVNKESHIRKSKDQLEKALNAIKCLFGKANLLARGQDISLNYAVVLPNQSVRDIEAIMSNYAPGIRDDELFKQGCFSEHLESTDAFLSWLHNMFSSNDELMDPQNTILLNSERADVYDKSLITLLSYVTDYPFYANNTLRKLINLTPGQATLLEACPEEQYISGPAGSGKTEVLILKVKKKKLEDQKKLVLCFTKALQLNYKTNRLRDVKNLDVKTFYEFLEDIIKSHHRYLVYHPYLINEEKARLVRMAISVATDLTSERKYDSIFVDEAQCLEGEWELLLDMLHKKGENHYKWIFYDSNQSVYYTKPPRVDKEGVFALVHVIRNTVNIYKQSLDFYSPREGCKISHNIEGPSVIWKDDFKDHDIENYSTEVLQYIESLVKEMCDQRTAEPGDICVLVENKTRSDKLIKALASCGSCIRPFSVEDMVRCLPRKKWPNREVSRVRLGVTVDSVGRFQGLESKAVFILMRDTKHKMQEKMYTSVTRCFCQLYVMCSERDKKTLHPAVRCDRYAEEVVPWKRTKYSP